MKILNWITGPNGRGDAGPKHEKPLDPTARAALVQKTFETLALVGFLKFRKEELALGSRVTEADRKEYFQFFEQSFRRDYEAILAKGSDAQVRDALNWWTNEAIARGLKEWQQEQGNNGREM